MVEHKITLHEVLQIVDSTKVKARTDLADIYLKESGRLVTDADRSLELSIKEKDTKRKGEFSFEERKSSIISILLSVFGLEAYINKIGHDELEDIWEVTERNSLPSKLLTYPLIITGKTLDKNKAPFSNFKEIKKWRDELVHYKMYESKDLIEHPSGIKVPAIYKIANAKNAKLAFDTVTEIIREIEKMLGRK